MSSYSNYFLSPLYSILVHVFCLFLTDENIEENEAIEPDKPQGELRQEPYSLPAGFHWDTLDIMDPLVVCNLYNNLYLLSICKG